MKTYPKVKAVQPQNDKQLLVTFDNGTQKLYDCKQLFNMEIFEMLKEDWLFRSVRADPGGYGVSWNENLDLSESELWEHGQLLETVDTTDR